MTAPLHGPGQHSGVIRRDMERHDRVSALIGLHKAQAEEQARRNVAGIIWAIAWCAFCFGIAAGAAITRLQLGASVL